MPNSKPWHCNKPWLLPKGLFDSSTSPVTPATANTPIDDSSSSPSSPGFPQRLHRIRHSNSFILNLQTVFRPSTNDHGMKHTHLEKRSEEKNPRVDSEEKKRAITQTNGQSHPAPWPMPPRRDYDLSDDTVAPTHLNAQSSLQNVAKPVSQISVGPKVSEIARRLMSGASASQENYQTPQESIADDEEIIEEDDSHSTEGDLRVPRAVFDRIAKLYPPAPRAPTFPDFKDLFKSDDNPTSSSFSVSAENEQEISSSSGSESSASVVDVLQLFADPGDGEPTVVEEDGVLQPPSIDHVRIHRRQAPLPSGVGDKSFLNVNGLRSLFDDKHLSASRTFSTLPPDSVTRARANALNVTDSSSRGGNFPRSRSDIPRPSTRIVPDNSGTPLGRTRSGRQSNVGADVSARKPRKQTKRKKKRDSDVIEDSHGGSDRESQTKLNGQKTDRDGNKPRTPPFLSNDRIMASDVIPDSPSMNLSPSSAAAVSVPSSPKGSDCFDSVRRSKPENLGPQRIVLSKQRTNVNPGAKSRDILRENEEGNNKVEMVGRGTGVFIRENMRRPVMDGIVRAETGWIAGPGELHGDGPPTAMQDNPNPKSLATFIADDATTQSSIFPTMRMGDEFEDVNSDSDSSMLEEPISRSFVNLSLQVRGGSAASSSSDGVYRVQSRSSEQERSDGRDVQTAEDASFKLVNRLRRAAGALGVRMRTGDPMDMGTSDLTMTGTLDEAMVRICYVCRKVLDYRVDVRDGGRKIRVESKDSSSTKLCLRVTLSLTEVGDVDKRCTLKVLQSRGDANRTNIATLWDFYRKLEKHLRKVEETGVLPNKPAGPSGVDGRSASTTNIRGSTSTSASGSDRAKHGGFTGGGNSRHNGNG